MTAALVAAVVLLALLLLVLVAQRVRPRPPRSVSASPAISRRILFPYLPRALSMRALDAALRLARAEDATLVPVFLARVALGLPLDAPLPGQAAVFMPLQEAIDQRASVADIPVDARIQRGRTYRHALRRAIATEHFDRIVVAAASGGRPGLSAEDVAWLLEYAPGEIIVLRPGSSDLLVASPARPRKRSIRALSRHGSRNTARKTVFTM